ncbi:hypothetical protein [Algoriphagus sp. PAP.12]|uniref:hypothetical protein n=1 Tax=Algoriphagus sp. PAP.12 TaxID=2996678 RepID=UPI00227A8DF3|nr:hypothetical protein [Algoriphagus sp. PAP.12]
MYFLRKISGFVSGIKTKKLTIEGRIVTYSYQGKFISINPFSMLRDLSYKAQGIAKLNSELKLKDLQEITFDCIPEFGNELNIRVQSKIDKTSFTIERSVKKMDQTPHTCYEFYFEEILIARLIKKYDYGSQFPFVVNTFKESLSEPTKEESNQASWKSGNQFLIAENFGHSHVNVCYDQELLLRIGNMVS